MAVVLDQYDQWEIDKEEDWLGQSPKIFITPEEHERRWHGVQRLKERLSPMPFHAERAAKESIADTKLMLLMGRLMAT